MKPLDVVVVRAVGAADAPALGALIGEGFETYREFQPADWRPPTAAHEAAGTIERLARPGAWGRIALDAGEPVGMVLYEPARDVRGSGEDLSGVAHLANLFVTPAWWGSGLAAELLRRAIAGMREDGYVVARLFTPEPQARARRFYEREGWRVDGEPFYEERLAMRLLQYRLALAGG